MAWSLVALTVAAKAEQMVEMKAMQMVVLRVELTVEPSAAHLVYARVSLRQNNSGFETDRTEMHVRDR